MATKFLQDLAIYQGDDWAATVMVTNWDGTPADLTGYTAASQIRTGPADQVWLPAAVLLCEVVPPDQISLSLTSEQTTLLRQPNYQWDLKVISPAGEITAILAGQVNVVFEITRVWQSNETVRAAEREAMLELAMPAGWRYER